MKQWRPRGAVGGSVRRLFVVYATVSLVPVVGLGAALVFLLHVQGDADGVADARANANMIARTAIAPLLRGRDLAGGLSPGETVAVRRTVGLAIREGDVLRLRIRALDGHVVFSDDRSGGGADAEALRAAHGGTVSELTWLNADANDAGPRGARVVEIYQPLNASQTGTRIGVLELYVPYAPIAAAIGRGQREITGALIGGLALLWLCLLGVSISVTGRLRRQVALNTMLAAHDALTGLPNRIQFAERATSAIQHASPHAPVAVALIDLDRFKQVNDTLGHSYGDSLLVTLGQRLSKHLQPGDIIARLGGDEFGVVLADAHDECTAVRTLHELRRAVAAPVEVGGVPLVLEASVGLALAPADGADVETLLQRADVAMYFAKRRHLAVARYHRDQDTYDSAALALIGELGHAIDRDELVLHFQPKADLHRGQITEVEALVRWQHPDRGLLAPDTFLPLAEQTELIDRLTHWVFRAAIRALPTVERAGRCAVAVNVSARSLARPSFATDVLQLFHDTGADPHRVIVEITETALLADPATAARVLNTLHTAGLRIAIDDFGAGQTSLGYLATLPVTELKIDKSFVLPMSTDPRQQAIVRSLIDLGHSLGFTVTAEGVETPETFHQLKAFGCDTVQGYLLARPTPLHDTPHAIAQANAHLAHLMPTPSLNPHDLDTPPSRPSQRHRRHTRTTHCPPPTRAAPTDHVH